MFPKKQSPRLGYTAPTENCKKLLLTVPKCAAVAETGIRLS